MNHCLICHEEIIIETSWENIFYPPERKKLCTICEKNIQRVSEESCPYCSKASTNKPCDDCKAWREHFNGKDPLSSNLSLLQYNDFIKEVIASWKYRGDYKIIEAFRQLFVEKFHKEFKKIEDFVIVPIPLSIERAKERGFNQAKQLASFLPGKIEDLLLRTSSEKQAKKTRRERIFQKNPFILTKTINRKVLLVDDIYTTGSTLRQAASLLIAGNCPKVYSYTLIRG